MNPRFRFTVGSEPEYEDLVGDLYFDDRIVCVLTQEEGFEAMQVRMFCRLFRELCGCIHGLGAAPAG